MGRICRKSAKIMDKILENGGGKLSKGYMVSRLGRKEVSLIRFVEGNRNSRNIRPIYNNLSIMYSYYYYMSFTFAIICLKLNNLMYQKNKTKQNKTKEKTKQNKTKQNKKKSYATVLKAIFG